MKRLSPLQITLFVGGLLLFAYAIYALGGSSVELIKNEFSWTYMWLYLGVSVISFVFIVWRWKAILDGYGSFIGFWSLLKIQLAGFAVSFVTPSARYGGEPLRIYMLKKDHGVDYKTGTVSVILDKYIEYLGALVFGIIGLVLLLFTPSIPVDIKWVLFVLLAVSVVGMAFIYHRFVAEKGFFYPLFNLFLSKKRIAKMSNTLKDVDTKMSHFMIHQKKAFFLSFIFYILSAITYITEFQFLLLAIGVSTTLLERILMVIVVGVASLIPSPMALGSMEAGQAGLFKMIKGNAGIGIFLSLAEKVKMIIVSAIGFLIIMISGGKRLLKDADEKDAKK